MFVLLYEFLVVYFFVLFTFGMFVASCWQMGPEFVLRDVDCVTAKLVVLNESLLVRFLSFLMTP
jgi:hypothetical protein